MRAARIFLCLAAGALCAGAAPQVWKHPDGRVAEGAAEDVSLADNGAILLAPGSKEVIPGDQKADCPPILWAGALDLKGSLFVGGGAQAEVIRVDKKGKADSIFDGDDLGVRALATSVAGDLYVATFPNGRVYRVTAEGKTEVYFEAEERYLWALATDAFDRLFVASGERGVVYSVTGRGEGKPFFDSDEAHITSLATDPSGRLIAGSSGRGLLYRLDNEGHAEVILDSRLDEVDAITVASDGTIYAAAISEPPPPRPRRPGDRASEELTIEVSPAEGDGILEEAAEQKQKLVIDLADLFPTPVEAKAQPASQVYRIIPGRTPVVVWSSTTERVYSLALDPHGHLLIGTGPAARLYRLEPDGSITLARQYPASQITSLVASAENKTYVITSNPGQAHALEASPASTGRYISPVRDAGGIASWGTVRWESDTPPGTRVEIAVRSGNSPSPDDTWSAWSQPLSDPNGSAVKAPPARYVQWRAELSRLKTEATPVLKRVSLSYLPENVAPSVRGVTLGDPGGAKPAPQGVAKPGEGAIPKGPEAPKAQGAPKDEAPAEAPEAGPKPFWLSWTSSDPDGDPLRYTVSVKKPEETEWRVLAKDVKEAAYRIDPSALPEGRYVARVEATDAEVNGPDRALTGEARSDPFEIDRTPPVIEPGVPEEASGTISLEFGVRDARSLVARAEYSFDSDGPWTMVPPRDGIADTSVETFLLRLPSTESRRRVLLRAFDSAGNAATLEVNLSRGH